MAARSPFRHRGNISTARTSAPAMTLTVAKDAASIKPAPRAIRHRTELAANATIASAVSVRIRVFESTFTALAAKTAGFEAQHQCENGEIAGIQLELLAFE